MDRKSMPDNPISISNPWRILGILILISALAGCIGGKSKLDKELSAQNMSEENGGVNNMVENQHPSNNSEMNQIRLAIGFNDFNKTGRLPVQLKIINPVLNETVLTVFKPQFGEEWTDLTNIAQIVNDTWIQNYTIRPKGNTSYVWMYVQISDNKTAVRKAAWNITFEVPVGRPT